MKRYKKAAFLVLFLTPLATFAQGDPEMADALRSSGKIWVVVIVIALIFLGLAAYLWSLDRKINRLEKEHQIK